MSVSLVESALSRWAAFSELSKALAEGVLCARATGLWGSARALVLAGVLEEAGRPMLSVQASAADRHRMALDIAFFLGALRPSRGRDTAPAPVLEFPSGEPASWRGGRHREQD